MTNDLKISRELAERICRPVCRESYPAIEELRALLADEPADDALSVERKEQAVDRLYLTMWPNDTLHECEAGNPKWDACIRAIDAGYQKYVDATQHQGDYE